MPLVLGVDVGSTTTKVVLIDGEQIAASDVCATGPNSRDTVDKLLCRVLRAAGRERNEVEFVVSTGYGRHRVEFADHVVSEITANAKGANWLAPKTQTIRTVIDIGGQDSKVISLDDDGIIANFAMNDKCAAGTGRFLEVMARALEVDLDAFGRLSLESNEDLPINSVCTVFAESEVISLLSEGKAVCDVIAALHRSVARQVAGLVHKVGVREAVFFDGGPALNRGLTRALERELGVELVVPECPQIATAIGAAFTAREMLERGNA